MSLLKRLEHGGAAPSVPVAPPPSDNGHSSSGLPEPSFRPSQAQTQASEAQRSLKDRVKRKLISELDPSLDTAMVDEVRLRLKNLFDQIIEAENLVLATHRHRGDFAQPLRRDQAHAVHLVQEGGVHARHGAGGDGAAADYVGAAHVGAVGVVGVVVSCRPAVGFGIACRVFSHFPLLHTVQQ